MIRTALRYHAPADVDEACGVLADRGDGAAVLGGGTWLVPMMTRGERAVTDVVDVRRLDLAGVRERHGEVVLGARVTYTAILRSALARERLPLLHAVAGRITGGPQVRNVATVGGSACHAVPSSDVPACLVALGARMVLHGRAGTREVPARDFFVGAFRTARAADELLTEIVFAPRPASAAYYKFKLCESSWPIATAAALVEDGEASVTLGGIAETPLRIEIPAALDAEAIDALVDEHLQDPWTDVLAAGSYRRAIAGVVARRALNTAREGASR